MGTIKTPRTIQSTTCIVLFALLAVLGLNSAAQAFTANIIGDYGDITVMEVNGNYDATLGDGSTNAVPREVISKKFYATHPDDYDFIAIITNFDFRMPYAEAVAFYLGVRNDIEGIGVLPFDNSIFFGSAGKLQGTIDMGNLAQLASDPLDPNFSFTLGTLSHELMHRWGSFIKIQAYDDAHNLLGQHGAHWSFLLDTKGSLMYGNPWQDNGDGTFTSSKGRRYYCPLDLYLMGLIDKSQVPPMLLIDSPGTDYTQVSKPGVTISGTALTVTIDDIIAANGERIPDSTTSQKEFKLGCVFITRPDTFTGQELTRLRAVLDNWVMWHSGLTNGLSKIVYRSNPLEALPYNPGPDLPAQQPRTTPPEIAEGIAWLMDQQKADGSWADTPSTLERDTTGAIDALSGADSAQAAVDQGIQWLDAIDSANFDYLARKIESIAQNGGSADRLIQTLLEEQQEDGGWGTAEGYTSNPKDTALVLRALLSAGKEDSDAVTRAANYLVAHQTAEGGWSGNKITNDIQTTAYVIITLSPLHDKFDLSSVVSQGISWLQSQRNPEGGIGQAESDAYDTAAALLAFKSYNAAYGIYAPAIAYLFERQSANGSWYDSVFQTSLAVQALRAWEDSIVPDLTVATTDIRFDPQSIVQRPQMVSVEITVHNNGFKPVDSTGLAIYDGVAIAENFIARQEVSIPARSSATATFDVTFDDTADHFIFAVVDPDYAVDESNEANNSAYAILMNDLNTDPDLVVSVNDMTFTPATIRRIPEQVELAVLVHNSGAADVPQVDVICYQDEMTADHIIGQRQIAVTHQSATPVTFDFTVTDGDLHRYFFVIDPAGLVTERNEFNNTAVKQHLPEVTYDFAFGQPAIALTQAIATKDQTIGVTVNIANIGTRDAFNVPVRIFIDDNGSIFDIATLTADVPFAGSASLHTDWIADHVGSDLKVYARIDPQDAFSEVSESNNTAYELLTVTERPEPNLVLTKNDITITPSPADEAGDATITALILNNGSGTTPSVDVAFSWNRPGSDPQPLGRTTIPSLSSGQSAQAGWTLTDIDVSGQWLVTVAADPDNQIVEVSEADNNAFKELTILRLPDLAVGQGSIGFSPMAPAEGQTVAISVTVQNSGDQDAVDVPVALYDGAVQIDAQTIATVPGNSQATVQFTYDTAGKPGVHTIRCMADPANAIVELDEGNNAASRTLGVQNGDLWLSQPYLSGDGGPDHLSTSFFFRLDAPTTVQVVVVNSRGRIVRTIGGPELTNTTGATVTWDGLSDHGVLVADGSYQMQARDMGGNVLRSLPVVMDNNLSSLAEAIGTKYLATANVTCMLPDMLDFQWFSDESGMVFTIDAADIDTPEFTPGLYTMAPDGEDIQRLVPWEWSLGVDPNYDYRYGTFYGDGKGFYLAPDDQSIAFILEKYNKQNDLLQTQLYVSDRFGETRTLVDGFDYKLESGGDDPLERLQDLSWSAGSTWLAYRVEVGSGTDRYEQLYLARPDGTDKTALPVSPTEQIQQMAWSPDGDRLLYILQDRGSTQSTVYSVRPPESPQVLLHLDRTTAEFTQWIDSRRLVVVGYDSLANQRAMVLLDADNAQSEPIYLWLDPEDYVVALKAHPFGEGFAYIIDRRADTGGGYGGYGGSSGWTEADGYDIVGYCDLTGQRETLYQSKSFAYFQSISDLNWSGDGMRLAFVDKIHTEVYPCTYASHLIVTEWPSRQQKAFPISYPMQPPFCGEGPSSFYFWTEQNGLWVQQAVLHYGSNLESRSVDLPRLSVDENGRATLRIIQTGTDTAGIDFLSLSADGHSYAPSSAVIVGSGTDILNAVLAQDGNSADAASATVAVTWENLPSSKTFTVSMTANEYNQSGTSTGGTGASDPDAGGDEPTYPEIRFTTGSLQWLYDGNWLVGWDSAKGHFAIDADTGEIAYFPIDEYAAIQFSPRSRYITFKQEVPPESVCFQRGSHDLWVMQSLLNLSADLRLVRESLTSSIELRATAADLNFDSFRIEYAEQQAPDDWNLIKPPVRNMVLDEAVQQWLPPGPGVYDVRLTVNDLAGHTKSEHKHVSWGMTSPIGNLYLEDDYVSANGDGVKDFLQLHYMVLEPVHLEFYVFDDNDTRVATLYRDYAAVPPGDGAETLVWDGRTQSGHIAEDGHYRVEVLGLSFPFIMDRTIPDVAITLSDIKVESESVYGTNPTRYKTEIYAQITGKAQDDNLSHWDLEYGRGDNPQEWYPLASGKASLPVYIDGELVTDEFHKFDSGELGLASGNKFRVVVEDLAGNRNVQTTEVLEEVLILSKWKDVYEDGLVWFDPGLDRSIGEEAQSIDSHLNVYHGYLAPAENALQAIATYRSPVERYTVQYRTELMDWVDGPQPSAGQAGLVTLEWNQKPPSLPNINAVRLRAELQSGQVIYSNPLPSKLLFDLDAETGVKARVMPFEALTSLRAYTQEPVSQPVLRKEWTPDAGAGIPYGLFDLYTPSELQFYDLDPGSKVTLEGYGVSGRRYFAEETIAPGAEPAFGLSRKYDCDPGNQSYTKRFELSLKDIEPQYLSVSVFRPDIDPPDPPTITDILMVSKELEAGKKVWDAAKGDVVPKGAVKLWQDADWTMPELLPGDYIVAEVVLQNGRSLGRFVKASPDFAVLNCCMEEDGTPIHGVIEDIPDLNYLRFEVNGDGEPLLSREWHADNGDTMPQGFFQLLDPAQVSPTWSSKRYRYRLYGQDSQGRPYSASASSDTPPDCAPQSKTPQFHIDLKTSPQVAPACDALSPGQVSLIAKLKEGSPKPVFPVATVRYYVERQGQWRLVSSRDLPGDVWEPAVIDTYAFSSQGIYLYEEGEYRVNAVAVDTQGHTADFGADLEADEKYPTFVVDRVMPAAQISAPAQDAGELICPIIFPRQGLPSKLYVDLAGTASDDRGLHACQFMFAYAATPDQWAPALDLLGKPITALGGGQTRELAGQWDVTNLMDEQVLLKFQVADRAGNVRCHVKMLNIDIQHELAADIDRKLFSPNWDGFLDDVTVSYAMDEAVTLDAVVLGPSGSVVKSLLSGYAHTGTKGQIVWDGTDNSGQSAPDGVYTIRLTATDACGNATEAYIDAVEIDNTPPVTQVTFPGPGSTLGTIVEVSGTADDLNFKTYHLEVLDETHPDPLQTLADGTTAVQNGYLGRWNTYGSEGRRRLRLSASDQVGNTSETVVMIDMGVRQDLIVDLAAAPMFFSPNNDGRLETVTISYGLNGNLNQAFNVLLELTDQAQAVVRTFERLNVSGGAGSFVWDGLNASGQPAADGTYQAVLTATLSTNSSIVHKEKVTVVLDATAPVVQVSQPADQDFVAGALTIQGTASDAHMDHYSLVLAGREGPRIVDQGQSNRQDHLFATLEDVSDGVYTLSLQAGDRGLIDSSQTLTLTVDKTPPLPILETPAQGALFGHDTHSVAINGSIEEENIQQWQLRYRLQSAAPDAWSILAQGQSLPGDALPHTWSVGPDDGVADGDYILSLQASDKAGWQAEATTLLTVDNTAPQVAITAPAQGSYVTAAVSIDGTALDPHLASYEVAAAPGSCDGAYQWAPIHTAETSVEDGALAQWQVLPPDGAYCLRLVAEDRVGQRSETKLDLVVDTHPPAAPVLSGQVEDRSSGRLTWTGGNENDLAGYNIYRDGQKLNTALLADLEYLDATLDEGAYIYIVRAVDQAGWQSEPSNPVTLEIDLTAPVARIRMPADGETVSGQVEIKGTAYSDDDFKAYRLYVGQGADPANWGLLNTSKVATAYGVLGQWDTATLVHGAQYSLRLETEDLAGNIGEHRIAVTIDNQPPAAPVLLDAASQGPLSSTADVTWQANSEADLAGYLLYRNEQLANVAGTVTGDLTPYLLAGTAYSDADLPDGTYTYYLLAMDTAGNLSPSSNRLSVTIDTHAPRAEIVMPQPEYRFDQSLMIRAACQDQDIAAIQFQYKPEAATDWIDLDPAVTNQPYIVYLNPEDLGLSFGRYDLRAVASDTGGRTDADPPSIAVEYRDITAPAAPIALAAQVNGGVVTLTWTANGESDLAGYNIYEINDTQRVQLNSALVDQATYAPPGEGDGLPDKLYHFQVFAVDASGNESPGSNIAAALVYAPQLEQPYSPTADAAYDLFGRSQPSDQVELFNDTGGGAQSLGAVAADDQGNFTFPVTFSPGVNRIFARAADAQGNISKDSVQVIVVHGTPPAMPTGLAGDVTDHDVALSWNPNQESDLAGYNLYRDGVKQNADQPVTGGTASASTYDYMASNAVDGSTNSYWRGYVYSGGASTWWQYDIGQTVLISQVTIDWYNEYSSPDSYELQAWTGYSWMPVVRVMGNTQTSNRLDIVPAYATDKIRLVISSGTADQNVGWVLLTEFKMQRLDPIPTETYAQQDVPDGRHDYYLEALNNLGMISPPSDELQIDVGDVTAPDAPISLAATADGSSIHLNWTAPAASDLAGYHVYRLEDAQWHRLNDALVGATAYDDADLGNGSYSYRVTAVDTAGNESDPSNTATAMVDIALPDQPMTVTATSQPQGGTIQVCWDAVDGSAGYRLYRATASGGPYTPVTEALLTDTCYLDSGLTDGQTYYYMVRAVDGLGNESADSLEADAVPADLIAPLAPVLFAPTIAGAPVTVTGSQADISGWAEPGSRVTLYRAGIQESTSSASAADSHTSFGFLAAGDAVDDVYQWALSPDGRYVAYSIYDTAVYEYVCRIYNASDGSWVTLAGFTDSFVWSPDSSRLALAVSTYDGLRIALYDVQNKQKSLITSSEAYFNEQSPSWSAKGDRLLYVSDQLTGSYQISSYDPSSGEVQQLLDAPGARSPVLSPDSRYLGYVVSAGLQYQLYIADLQTSAAPVMVDDRLRRDNFGMPCMAWSPQGTELAYIANSGGLMDIYSADATTHAVESLTSLGDVAYFAWLPGGRHLSYLRRNGSSSIWIETLETTETRQLQDLPLDLFFSGFSISGQGQMGYRSAGSVVLVSPAGRFDFQAVSLSPGDNSFSATAADAAGNQSPASEPIMIHVDSDLLPDLQVTTENLYHYPYVPVDGQQVDFTAIAANTGSAAATNVRVDCFIWDAQDQTRLVHTEVIPSLAAGEERQVHFTWDSTGFPGRTTVIVELDPEDTVFEASEYNNMAFRNLYVAAGEGLAMETTTPYDLYNADENVDITVELYNAGQEQEVTLRVSILDSQQAPVALVTEEQFPLPYTPLTSRSFVWNTGIAPVGAYFVRAVLSGPDGQLAENMVPFTIEAQMNLKAELNTDRLHYDSDQTVQIHGVLRNQSPNMVLTDLSTRMIVRNATGDILAEQIGQIDYLFGDSSAAVNMTWDTGAYPPGQYTATLITEDGPLEIARAERTFFIDAVARTTGSLSLQPAVVTAGTTVAAQYTVSHYGNTAVAGLPVNVAIVDPATLADLAVRNTSVDIGMGGEVDGTFQFDTGGFAPGTYPVQLRATAADGPTVLAETSLTVRSEAQFPVTLSGTLAAEPQTVTVGDWVTLRYTVTNESGMDLDALKLRVAVPEGVTGEFQRTLALPVGATLSGQFVLSTSNLIPDSYTSTLRVNLTGNLSEAQLGSAAFEVVEPEPRVHAPVAIAGGPYLLAVGETLEVNGSGSFDLDQDQSETGDPPLDTITDYRWETNPVEPYAFDDAVGATALLPAYASPGTYSVILQVTDNTAAAFPGEGLPNLTGTGVAEVNVYSLSMEDIAARPKATKCQITWSHVGAAEYEVLRSETGPDAGFETIAATTSTYSTYLDEPIEMYKDYWYRVRCTLDGEVKLSNAVHVYSAGRTR